jgi:NAD(P)-dependent dehydrogenase (short-subunit alcohol dehydrogenase family)
LPNDLDLTGRTALVTGSGRNIGRACILEFAANGANVIVNARSNEAEANEVAKEAEAFGVRSLVVMGDAADPEVVQTMKREAEAAFGGVDIYVSNAARRLHKTFWDTTDADWHQYLNQQLTASWYLAKAFAPGMRERGWGRIIHMNGPDGWVGGWTRIPHSTAKGALRTLTKSLASGLGEFGITVNDINPGHTDTIRDPETHPEINPTFTAEIVSRIPTRARPVPDEIAWACLFLCSHRSRDITGSVIHIDGGLHMIG